MGETSLEVGWCGSRRLAIDDSSAWKWINKVVIALKLILTNSEEIKLLQIKLSTFKWT
jgi:hypothetical protein